MSCCADCAVSKPYYTYC